jgi:hypothetical protein
MDAADSGRSRLRKQQTALASGVTSIMVDNNASGNLQGVQAMEAFHGV